MSRIVIIGVGMIGARHVRCFARAGHQIVTVDRRSGADFAEIAQVPDPSTVDSWAVATPTATHLTVVEEILRHQPHARILLEKPACYPAEIAELVRVIGRHPLARVVVNDVYEYSATVRRLAESVREYAELDPISKVIIEFTKNREHDVANGRFVDTQYGEAGYEFFHMLSILRAILPPEMYQTYLRTPPTSITPEMRVRTSAPDLPDIELYASTTGAIGYANLAGFAFSDNSAKSCLMNSHIPYGADLRYRFADVELRSGRHITLVFEPCYGMPVDYKNMHAVHIHDAATQQQFMISGNHFEEALLLQLNLLRQAETGTSLIRLAEHEYMAGLGRAGSRAGS